MTTRYPKTRLWAAITLALAATALVGCTSDADMASYNLGKAAEQFEVQRSIIGINGITGDIMFSVEGRCSIETADSAAAGSLEITCKYGPDDYRKHFVGLSDNVTYVVTQLEGIDVSEYHTRVIIKPQNLLPQFDLVVGEDD